MKLKHLTSALLLVCAASAPAAEVTVVNNILSYSETTPSGSITIRFERCMANNLFTFKSVMLDGKTVNLTESDNIGPFMTPSGWIGGNHTNSDGSKSAKTKTVSVMADGTELPLSGRRNVTCKVLTIKVENDIYMPGSATGIFARETMTYVVAGNSIDVTGEHEYECANPVMVNRYYGMQSMFIDETEILTPGGRYKTWTPTAQVDRFTKLSAPLFNTFIEHSANGYQAAWMDPSTGLGDRWKISDTDVVFIGNSYGKSYHKIIGDRTVKYGDKTTWHGVYTWFNAPLTDECRGSSAGTFSYAGSVGGKAATFTLASDGRCTVAVDDNSGIDGIINENPQMQVAAGKGYLTVENAPEASVYSLTGNLVARGEGSHYCPAGIYIVSDNHGHSVKVLVR